MRLLDTRTLELVSKDVVDKEARSSIPKYAILSHRWTEEEIKFEDIAGNIKKATRRKKGWSKMRDFCNEARENGYNYAWIDTCCINKTSSQEVGDSISSMFDWYREADVCYVYLADYEHGADPNEELGKCEWWTRGWTLQELLAPSNVRFYDKTWARIGDKRSLSSLISRITLIPELVLRGEKSHSDYSVAQRLSWAAARITTHIEDTAYCLLGLFGINMPLFYGERHRAFLRLQKEILANIYDSTIFAWNPSGTITNGILAGSPRDFKSSSDVLKLEHSNNHDSMTPQGVLTKSTILVQGSSRVVRYCMRVGHRADSSETIAVPLEMVGPHRYERLPGTALINVDSKRDR
ncbi:HET-domain-containing protein [Hypoxylon sp. FL1150]|nr:HET-domain-containing protein [Hypoxylon sp. FL1150]